MAITSEGRSDWVVNVLSICALLVTSLVVRHELFPGTAPTEVQESPELRDSLSEAIWKELTTSGHWIGAPSAHVVFVEFSDYQCPSCRSWTRSLQALQALRPEDVALVVHHFPLSEIHREAISAAVASECAADDGRFEPFHYLLFRNQDHLGGSLYYEAADSVEVRSRKKFRECLSDPRTLQRVERDRERARRLGLTTTPTVWGNRKRLSRVPDTTWVDQVRPRVTSSR